MPTIMFTTMSGVLGYLLTGSLPLAGAFCGISGVSIVFGILLKGK